MVGTIYTLDYFVSDSDGNLYALDIEVKDSTGTPVEVMANSFEAVDFNGYIMRQGFVSRNYVLKRRRVILKR